MQEFTQRSWFKKLLPGSLFGRAFLILTLPMLLVQAFGIYMFYDRHWDNVQRHLSTSLTGDVAFLVHEMQTRTPEHRDETITLARRLLHIDMRMEESRKDSKLTSSSDDEVLSAFANQLDAVLDEPFSIRRSRDEGQVVLRVELHDDSILRMQFSVKRLSNITAQLFVVWTIGSALLLTLIAMIFLRNQIRPIRKLAEAAERFGKGQEVGEFRPQGASEVRQAGRSFIAMRERLKRMINGRTDMLASISHDMRTPLTRLRLELAMLPEQKLTKGMLVDVQDMERMIQEYLDFARGEGGEQMSQVKLSTLLSDVIEKYTRAGQAVSCTQISDPEMTLLYHAMRRALHNIVDNALRFGTACDIRTEVKGKRLVITLDDDGPGIASDKRELALQPFKRLDEARNLDTSGAGLGLSIVQGIVQRHGGTLALEDSPLGGLRVRIELPL